MVWHVQGILLCSQSLPRTLHAMLCCDLPWLAVPCRVELCHAALHHDHATLCRALSEAGRGASQDIWQERPDPAPAGEAPACAWAPVVLLRSSSAQGMIDLLSASGGLSRCQASAQTGALKGESPFPLRKAEQQSPAATPCSVSTSWALLALWPPAAAQPWGVHRGQQGVHRHLGSEPCQAELTGLCLG